MKRANLPLSVVLTGALALTGGTGACVDGPLLPETGDQITVDFDRAFQWPTDPWNFVDADVVDGELELELAYGGGCEEHGFWIVAVEGFHELPSFGPTPMVSVPILVAHEARDDPCEAYITETHRVGLQPLRDAFVDEFVMTTGRVILRVPRGQGAADSVYVEYVIE